MRKNISYQLSLQNSISESIWLLNEVSDDKTTIMIPHRLGITKFADEIILMKYGQVIEKGSHEELMDKHGEYRGMYEAQAEYYNI